MILLLATTSVSSAPSRRDPLFFIGRSTNSNVVEFEASLLPDGRIDPAAPVQAYWRLLAEDGRREELTWLEKQFAYGFTVERQRDGFALKLLALARRTVRVEKRDGRYRATLAIANRPAILRRVWVQVDGTLLGPHVLYVDVHGVDATTGAALVERIENR